MRCLHRAQDRTARAGGGDVDFFNTAPEAASEAFPTVLCVPTSVSSSVTAGGSTTTDPRYAACHLLLAPFKTSKTPRDSWYVKCTSMCSFCMYITCVSAV